MIGLALVNLLRNARQHTPADGSIIVRAEHVVDRLHISVRDNGPGIALALRDTLFEPFVTSRADGTGLGLAIAREMAEAHGGHLNLLAGEQGAAFLLDIPWVPAPGAWV